MSEKAIIVLFKAFVRGLRYMVDQIERAMKEVEA